jgi:hypothetical protein
VFSARNGPTADGPCYARARYEPAGPISCPRSGGSAVGRPEAPIGFRDGFPKPPTGGFRRRPRPAETFRSFRPTKLPGRPLPRPGVGSRLPGGGPSRWRPHTASAVPAGRPAPDRPAESVLSVLPCTAPWVPGPHTPRRSCRGTAGSRIDSVRSGRCPHSRIGGTGKSESPESWHPSEGEFPLWYITYKTITTKFIIYRSRQKWTCYITLYWWSTRY